MCVSPWGTVSYKSSPAAFLGATALEQWYTANTTRPEDVLRSKKSLSATKDAGVFHRPPPTHVSLPRDAGYQHATIVSAGRAFGLHIIHRAPHVKSFVGHRGRFRAIQGSKSAAPFSRSIKRKMSKPFVRPDSIRPYPNRIGRSCPDCHHQNANQKEDAAKQSQTDD